MGKVGLKRCLYLVADLANAWKGRTIKKRLVLANEGIGLPAEIYSDLVGIHPAYPPKAVLLFEFSEGLNLLGIDMGSPLSVCHPKNEILSAPSLIPLVLHNRHSPPRVKGKIGVDTYRREVIQSGDYPLGSGPGCRPGCNQSSA